MSPTIPPCAGVLVPTSAVLPAVIAAGSIAAGHEASLLIPPKTAASSTCAIASASAGRSSPHASKLESSTTASGIGTMHAISSAVRVTPCHAASVVCFKPVSPATQYATGSADRTGCTFSLVESCALRQSVSAALSCVAAASAGRPETHSAQFFSQPSYLSMSPSTVGAPTPAPACRSERARPTR